MIWLLLLSLLGCHPKPHKKIKWVWVDYSCGFQVYQYEDGSFPPYAKDESRPRTDRLTVPCTPKERTAEQIIESDVLWQRMEWRGK